jgi:hypothetical protein
MFAATILTIHIRRTRKDANKGKIVSYKSQLTGARGGVVMKELKTLVLGVTRLLAAVGFVPHFPRKERSTITGRGSICKKTLD